MKKNRIAFILAFLVFAFSCKKSENVQPEPVAPVLQVNKTAIQVKSLDTEDSIVITANREWKITIPSDAFWIKLNKASGKGTDTVKFSIDANYLTGVRKTNVKVELSDNSVTPITISIEQKKIAYTTSWTKAYGGSKEDFASDFIKTEGGYVIPAIRSLIQIINELA